MPSSIDLLRELSGLIHLATEGVVDRLRRLLDTACLYAVNAKWRRISGTALRSFDCVPICDRSGTIANEFRSDAD
jgi:hypothetical protein